MAFKISDTLRNAEVDGIMSELDAGTIEFRTGTQPATTSDAATGTLLATLTLLTPAAAAASGGSGSASLPVTTSSTIAGTIGWARVKTSTGTAMLDGTVTDTGGGGDITVSTVILDTGDTLNLSAFTITAPAL